MRDMDWSMLRQVERVRKKERRLGRDFAFTGLAYRRNYAIDALMNGVRREGEHDIKQSNLSKKKYLGMP